MSRLIIYDSTIEGLFSAMAYAVSSDEPEPRFAPEGSAEPGLFEEPSVHTTNHDRADKFFAAAKQALGSELMSNLLCAFLSCDIERERYIYDYVRAGFKYRAGLGCRLTEYPVDIINKTAARVRHESHRMKGLIRFSAVENSTLYAPVEPDNDILPLVAGHFQRRMPRERWMIHDLKRGRAVFHDKGRADIVSVTLNRPPAPEQSEEFYRTLWRSFHSAIAIKERKNPRLQKQFMPVRYWKYITEKQS